MPHIQVRYDWSIQPHRFPTTVCMWLGIPFAKSYSLSWYAAQACRIALFPTALGYTGFSLEIVSGSRSRVWLSLVLLMASRTLPVLNGSPPLLFCGPPNTSSAVLRIYPIASNCIDHKLTTDGSISRSRICPQREREMSWVIPSIDIEWATKCPTKAPRDTLGSKSASNVRHYRTTFPPKHGKNKRSMKHIE